MNLNQSDNHLQSNLPRRDFLKISLLVLGGLASLEIGGIAFAYLQPQTGEGEFGNVISVGKVDQYPPGSISHISNGQFFLARLSDGGFLALYQRCPHLGCVVQWEQGQERFNCPCHNSQFTQGGNVLNPPSPRPLDLFPIEIREGKIFVDTGQPIQRDRPDPFQVTYA